MGSNLVLIDILYKVTLATLRQSESDFLLLYQPLSHGTGIFKVLLLKGRHAFRDKRSGPGSILDGH
jgi:hypothetical protein